MKKMTYQDDGLWFRDDSVSAAHNIVALPYLRDHAASPADVILAAPTTPSAAKEVAFLNGINADGKITDDSFWGSNGGTAFKWGDSTAGTGATITYSFKGFSENEQNTLLEAMALWSSVADVTFVEAANQADADVLMREGRDFSAYSSTQTRDGEGFELGEIVGQSLLSIDTRVPGFDLSGSFQKSGGYGLSTAIHEVGHMLGLGHGGAYNGSVDPGTQQYSAYDDRMYTIMSYISYEDGDAKFADQNPVQGTDWGNISAPHSMMALDILAIQQLYGAADSTQLDGGEIYGFNCNIDGLIGEFFDFTVNKTPVVTLFNQGKDNILDASGYDMGQTIDLHAGAFSDIGGLDNNVCIAFDTRIEKAIGGSGDDDLIASELRSRLFGNKGDDDLLGGAAKDRLEGGKGDDTLTAAGGKDNLFGNAGQDTLTGGGSGDAFIFENASDSSMNANDADAITDFVSRKDTIDLSAIDARTGGGDNAFTFIGKSAFGNNAGELRFEVVRGDTLISGDIDGNGQADFTIRLEDVTSVVAADFVL